MFNEILMSSSGEVISITPESNVDLTIPIKYEAGWVATIGSLVVLYALLSWSKH